MRAGRKGALFSASALASSASVPGRIGLALPGLSALSAKPTLRCGTLLDTGAANSAPAAAVVESNGTMLSAFLAKRLAPALFTIIMGALILWGAKGLFIEPQRFIELDRPPHWRWRRLWRHRPSNWCRAFH